MKVYKIFTLNFLLFTLLACNGSKKSATARFSIDIQPKKTKFQQDETIKVAINNPKNLTIDSVIYSINKQQLPINNNSIKLSAQKLGKHQLTATVYFNNSSEITSKNITLLAKNAPKIYTYTIVNEYPHDNKAYTQGLEFYNDTLYESTGKNGQSSLRKVNYKTGEVLKNVALDDIYFGEGITILNNKIYQLTWLKKIGFVYDAATLTKTGSFAYGKSKEGWGLCNNGSMIFKSDGTDKIWLLNPETLVEGDYIQTVTNKSVFNKANELEYVNGKIYANVYQKESMMIIDPTSGAIEGVVNFAGLKEKISKGTDWDDENNVLNGIAFNPKTNTLFVTGKFWDKLFEVTITPK